MRLVANINKLLLFAFLGPALVSGAPKNGNTGSTGGGGGGGGNRKAPPPTPAPTPSGGGGGIQCPPSNQPGQTVDISNPSITLANSAPGTLCALFLTSADGTNIKPVSRSYNGHNWERYAGGFSSIDIDCSGGDCTVLLTPPEEAGATYTLMGFDHSISSKNQIARFLEQITFGPTQSEISGIEQAGTSFEAYIQQQQRLDITSHRQFFREHQNHRMDATSYQYLISHPCKKDTRYRAFAFSQKDDYRFIEIKSAAGPGDKKILLIDGLARTLVDGPVRQGDYGTVSYSEPIFTDGTYKICYRPEERVGGRIRVTRPGKGCVDLWFGPDGAEVRGNPRVTFDDFNSPGNGVISLVDHVTPFGDAFYAKEALTTQELYVNSDINDSNCNLFSETYGVPEEEVAIGQMGDGSYWIHTPSFVLQNNDVDSPIPDGGNGAVLATAGASFEGYEVQCSSAPRTFLNEDGCVRSTNGCTATEIEDVDIPLEIETFRRIHTATGGGDVDSETRYVYAVTNLRQGEINNQDFPPCTAGERSRWIKLSVEDCAAASFAEVGPGTKSIFEELISSSNDVNVKIRDVSMPLSTVATCDAGDENKIDFTIAVGDDCWQNTHPNNYQIYDFTIWTLQHPGNSDARNPIKEFAELSNTYTLQFPSWHTMRRWYQNKDLFDDLGRLGDTTSFSALPGNLQREDIADEFGASVNQGVGADVIVCGSPFESANGLSTYGIESKGGFDIQTRYNRTSYSGDLQRQRRTTWIEIALNAVDQFRQRAAWCLYQILSLSPDAIGATDMTESFLTYYDIFVRHSFGNYRDILKEVAYSPLMAEMLSYRDSKSTGYRWTRNDVLEYADENFAREIMQLFSIGLYPLNEDGTPQNGGSSASLTYTNFDITEYARAWTGFRRQPLRGNVEDAGTKTYHNNQVDPMRIDIQYRDHLPKLGLRDRYVGDGYVLCADLPAQPFLKQGATFRLLGGNPRPTLTNDPDWRDGALSRFSLDPVNSALAAKLCNKSNPNKRNSPCEYQINYVLDQDVACYGNECNIDTLSTFQVEPGVYYEYVKPPCVQHAFYDDAVTIKKRWGTGLMCADKSSMVASVTCCSSELSTHSSREGAEFYSGERLSYDRAVERCDAVSASICENPNLYSSGWDKLAVDNYLHYWTTLPCNMKIKISEEGRVAIVHAPESTANVDKMVNANTKMFFRVIWSDTAPVDALIGDYESKCTEMAGCGLAADGFCVCDVTSVAESAAFTTIEDLTALPISTVLSTAVIGALPPSSNGYQVSGNIKIHDTTGSLTVNSILEIIDENNIKHYRKNILSEVSAGELSFRNPLHFISVQDPELFRAHQETDATIDHYFYHPNTAPFLAVRFAQRFGVSNPSPRYVEAVATAFRTGKYIASGGTQFGSGQYGDLAAAFAAVVLDREARSVVLDADPMHGSLLEPYMKIVRVMRSLGFQHSDDDPLVLIRKNLQDEIGQEAHRLPGVFSFFRPEFQPAGRINHAGLVSPESQVLTGPNAVNMMNIMLSYLKYGLHACYDGFGYGTDSCRIGNSKGASGASSYTPLPGATAAEIVEELSTLLTSGRLNAYSKRLIETAYQDTINIHGKTDYEALVNAEQLIALTPEFHTSGLAKLTEVDYQEPTPPPESPRPYKAVVKILLNGGYDSFNMLVPETCTGTNAAGETVRDQYDNERGVMKFVDYDPQLNKYERSLKISVDDRSENQPCEEFVVHDELEIVKELYDSGDLLFFANTGVINQQGYTKQNYYSLTKTQLFAHNAMQDEAQKVDPYNEAPGTGVLGRAAEILQNEGFKVNGMSIDNPSLAVSVPPGSEAPAPLTVSRYGARTFNQNKPGSESYFDAIGYTYALNGETEIRSNIFGDNWKDQFTNGISNGNRLKSALDEVELDSEIWYDENNKPRVNGYIQDEHWRKFSTLYKLIKSHDSRGTDREVFFAEFGGWDTHSDMKSNIRPRFNGVNHGLKLFVSQLKAAGLWDQVTIVVTSDFARTITPNSGDGSDHAWGGHYFMAGGSVDGGKILGEYPSDITPAGPLNIGRGRIIPTTSWDAIWSGVVEWMGVPANHEDPSSPSDRIGECIPNGRNAGTLYKESDLFKAPPPARKLRGSAPS